jgi:hypothetical protein
MITDANTIVPCSECKQPVAVKDAIIVPRDPAHPEGGVWLFDRPACQERHAIARKVLPIIRALPPRERRTDPNYCSGCGMPPDECACEPEW